MDKSPTLPNIIDNQTFIYGQRNRIRFGSLTDRINFLFVAASDFKKLVRKKKDKKVLGAALARILSRIVCVAEYFDGRFDVSLPLAECFAQKWLGDTCRYCAKSPCECWSDKRPEPIYADQPSRLDWELRQICAHLDGLYSEANRLAGGIDVIYSRLIEEIAEVIVITVSMTFSQEPNALLLEELAYELSDAIAWTISLANFLPIDLQDAYLDRYDSGCRRCKQPRCQCLAFEWPAAAAWAETLKFG